VLRGALVAAFQSTKAPFPALTALLAPFVATGFDQSLLSDFDALTASVSALADRAATGFDSQTAAFAALSGAMGDTIVSMREAASYAERLLEEYVQQQTMLEAAMGVGGGGSLGCTRPSRFAVRFNVTYVPPGAAVASEAGAPDAMIASAAGTASPGGRRRLMQAAVQGGDAGSGGGVSADDGSGSSGGSDGSRAGSSLISDELVEWEGYRLAVEARGANWGADAALAPERSRCVGGAAGANRVIGGLFLHATRRPAGAACAPGSHAAALSFDCARAAAGVPLSRNGTAAAAAALAASSPSALAPYGIDPAFLRSSSLYRPDLAGREGLYYNTSDPHEVAASTGSPYGFFHRRLEGYADGFPILLTNRMGAARAGEAVQYLLDGNYLDG
jgi:hypothetical protein